MIITLARMHRANQLPTLMRWTKYVLSICIDHAFQTVVTIVQGLYYRHVAILINDKFDFCFKIHVENHKRVT